MEDQREESLEPLSRQHGLGPGSPCCLTLVLSPCPRCLTGFTGRRPEENVSYSLSKVVEKGRISRMEPKLENERFGRGKWGSTSTGYVGVVTTWRLNEH